MNRVIARTMATAAGKSELNLIRSWGPVGAFLRDQKSLVPETQRAFKASPQFTFLKKDTDKATLALAFGVVGLGLILAGRGE